MNNSRVLILMIMILPHSVLSQTDSSKVNNSYTHQYHMQKDLTIITGFQFKKNQFLELGIGIIKDGVVGSHPNTLIYGISNELKLSKDFIWGLKAGLWAGGGAGGMNMGINLINYTDFETNSLRFRPEIGFGFSIIRVVYGYNFALTNKNFEGINRHNFGVNFMLNIKSLKYEKGMRD